jgi:SMI1 / KNR4 family (SUKH-1)
MDWIERLKEFANDSSKANWHCTIVNAYDSDGKPYRPTANAPAMLEEIMELEAAIGYRLPEDLRKVYLEVGNGGFGPGYGLKTLGGCGGLLDSYSFVCKFQLIDRFVKWPENYLPICSGGCDLLGVLDLLNGKVGFLQYEIGEAIPSKGIHAATFEEITEWYSPTIQSWICSWMDGENSMEYSPNFWNDKMNALVEIRSRAVSANLTNTLNAEEGLPF